MIRLLLVDDQDLVLHVLAATLGPEPDLVVVGTAATIEEALRVAAETLPDVVVVDYRLPDGDGPTATRRLLQATPGLKVIMLTGRDDPAARVAAFEAGCCGFVAKGAKLDVLAVAVRAAVGASG